MIYIFLFYTKGEGKPLKWTLGKYKHVEMITHDDNNCISWTVGSLGLSYRELRDWPQKRFISHLWGIKKPQAMIVLRRHMFEMQPWRPLLIRSCNELYRYMANLDIPCSIWPCGFYKKLIRYNSIRNYTILEHWRRENGEMG